MRKALALATLLLLPALADEPPDPARPPGARPHRVHALVDARVVTRPGEELARATVLIRDGRIEAVGDVAIPGDARVWDMRGLTIYPGLIEPYYAPEDVPPEPKKEEGRRGRRGSDEGDAESPTKKGAGHYAPEVRPERSIAAEVELSPDALRELRKAGFTVALLAPGKGILRGTSAAVCLRDGSARQQVLRADVAQHLAFAPRSDTTYPSSLMGAMSLVRQTFLDAEHHLAASAAYAEDPMSAERPEANRALEALRPVLAGERPICVQAEDAASLLRAAAILSEFDLVPWAVLGDQDAYRWLDELQAAAAPLVVSLNFPPVPEWEGPDEALEVETRALHHWWLAPECPARLEQAQLRFAFTAHGLLERASWRARVREAVARGLSEEAALAALTTAPAALLGLPQVGVVAPGALANLTISDGPLFAEETRLVEVWVDGERYPTSLVPPSPEELAGRWTIELQLSDEQVSAIPVRLAYEKGALGAAIDSRAWPAGAPPPATLELAPPLLSRDQLELRLPPAAGGAPEDGPLVRVRVVGRRLIGTWRAGAEGGPARGLKQAKEREDATGEKPAEAPRPVGILPWPAWPPHPEPEPAAVLVRGATIWTQGPLGTFVGDLLCQGGVIAAVGTTVAAPAEALVIEGKGLHVSPGMIDCHNHSYVVGDVNEASRSCTSMVRIADVLDPETIRIYQHLAGGLTCANVLHGSANAIGGQNAVVKLRWGETPMGLLFLEAPQGMKWALGENPKRSNWGQGLSPRYPTTRMGVVETIRERLTAARDYAAELEAWTREPEGTPPRIDLELQALAEILEGSRLVHCHSYRQDEILAVIRLAEQLGFTIGTFQHVLEGYKVADEIAAHGAGASSFSDWWSYKYEVIDAIAYSPALMVRRGVLVSVNSDSNELARRLNQEAAKSMRWGGLGAEESLALVTLNPARQLGVGDLVGSLEAGKQADFVVWSASPLSTKAVCLETWIEGRRMFQRDRDRAAWATGQLEREALLAAAAAARWGEGARRAKDWRRTFGSPGHGHEEEQGCCTGGGR